MNMKLTLPASVIVGMLFSTTSLAAGLTDVYDPYVTADEISATPAMPTPAEERMADIYDPFILSNEIVVTEGCVNPANELLADQYDSFVTLAELEAAEKNKVC